MKFLAGLILGLVLGAATIGATVDCLEIPALGGLPLGWSVTKGGRKVCDSPTVYTMFLEIKC
jgi:hypothetical protein